MTKNTCTTISILAFIFIFALTALAQMQSANYLITTSVLSSGGAPMTSASYQTDATLGQPSPLMDPADPPYSTSYDLYPGFWYTLEAALYGCWWDIEPEFGDGDVDGSDLAEFSAGFAAGYYDESDLAAFVLEFGSTDC